MHVDTCMHTNCISIFFNHCYMSLQCLAYKPLSAAIDFVKLYFDWKIIYAIYILFYSQQKDFIRVSDSC